MKGIVAWALTLLPVLSVAQTPDTTGLLLDLDGMPSAPRRSNDRFGHRLTVQASGTYDLSTAYNDLARGLLRGDVIDRSTRERSQDALNSNNRAGYVLEGGLSYAWGDSLFGRGGLRPRLAVMHHDLMGMRYADEAYDLTFFGNAAYEDRTAELAPSAFERVRYQTVAFGAEHLRTGSYIMLALVNGSALNAGDIDRADLYTAPDGRYLDLDIEGRYWSSDTAGSGYLRQNALGAAVSARWNFFPTVLGRRSVLSVQLDDAGFAAWNSSSLTVDKDSLVHYEGVRVVDVIDLDGNLIGANELQDSLGFGYTRGAFTRALPMRLGVQWRVFSRNMRWSVDLAADQRYLAGYMPHASVALRHHWRCLALAAEGSYGGAGGLRAGLSAHWRMARHWLLNVRSSNLIGTVDANARGMAAQAGLEVEW